MKYQQTLPTNADKGNSNKTNKKNTMVWVREGINMYETNTRTPIVNQNAMSLRNVKTLRNRLSFAQHKNLNNDVSDDELLYGRVTFPAHMQAYLETNYINRFAHCLNIFVNCNKGQFP